MQNDEFTMLPVYERCMVVARVINKQTKKSAAAATWREWESRNMCFVFNLSFIFHMCFCVYCYWCHGEYEHWHVLHITFNSSHHECFCCETNIFLFFSSFFGFIFPHMYVTFLLINFNSAPHRRLNEFCMSYCQL